MAASRLLDAREELYPRQMMCGGFPSRTRIGGAEFEELDDGKRKDAYRQHLIDLAGRIGLSIVDFGDLSTPDDEDRLVHTICELFSTWVFESLKIAANSGWFNGKFGTLTQEDGYVLANLMTRWRRSDERLHQRGIDVLMSPRESSRAFFSGIVQFLEEVNSSDPEFPRVVLNVQFTPECTIAEYDAVGKISGCGLVAMASIPSCGDVECLKALMTRPMIRRVRQLHCGFGGFIRETFERCVFKNMVRMVLCGAMYESDWECFRECTFPSLKFLTLRPSVVHPTSLTMDVSKLCTSDLPLSLRELTLSNVDVTDGLLRMISRLRHVDGEVVSSDGVPRTISKLRKLTLVNIKGPRMMELVEACPGIEELCYNYGFLDGSDLERMGRYLRDDADGGTSCVKRLSFGSCGYPDDVPGGFKKLTDAIGENRTLEFVRFDMRSSRIRDHCIEHMHNLRNAWSGVEVIEYSQTWDEESKDGTLVSRSESFMMMPTCGDMRSWVKFEENTNVVAPHDVVDEGAGFVIQMYPVGSRFVNASVWNGSRYSIRLLPNDASLIDTLNGWYREADGRMSVMLECSF